MKYHIFNKLVIVLLFVACKNDSQQFENDTISFPNTIELTGINTGPKNYFGSPIDCISSGNDLLVFDTGKDFYFHLLDESLKIKQTLLKKGHGPGEMDNEPILSHYDFNRLGGIYYYDFVRSSIVKLPVSNDGSYDDHSPEEIHIPEELYNLQSVTILEDSIFVGNGGMAEGKLFFFFPGTRENVIKTPFIPPPSRNNDREYMMYSYLGKVTWDPKSKSTYFANSYFPQIEVYGDNYEINNIVTTDKHAALGREKMFYYHGIEYGLQKVFALYLGENSDNLLKNLFGDFKSKLHVFDKDGNPLLEIKLDRLLTSFTLDVRNGRIIGIDEGNEEQPLVEYTLPNQLLNLNEMN